MKKKLLVVLLLLTVSLACIFGLSACAGKEESSAITVTLKANGGAFTDGRTTVTLTVEANSSIDGLVPVPVSENYLFEGWTETENGTELWDVSKQLVTKDITLFAVWTEKVTVTFFANGGAFEDGKESVQIEQKKGMTVTLPAEPERDGYTFGGWYKANVTDGEVTLTEGFDSGSAVSENVSVYAKWVLEKGVRLPKPTGLIVESDKITWNQVDGASGYRVVIYDEEKQQIGNANPSGTYYNYDFSVRGEGAYTVTVCAVGDGIDYANSEYASVKFNYGLTKLTIAFDASASELSWEAADKKLPAATSYNISIYDVESGDEVYKLTDVLATCLDLSFLDAGKYRAGIISGKENFTSVSQSFEFIKLRLATPEISVFCESEEGDFDKVVLSWNEVKYATRYIITVGSLSVKTSGTSYTITGGALSGGSSLYSFTCGEGKVAVRAFDEDYDYLVSLPAEEAVSVSALAKITASAEYETYSERVTFDGSLYKYNQAPFTVTFNYYANLYLRYPTVKALMDYYNYNLSASNRVGGASRELYFTTQEVTANSGVKYPEYYKLSLITKLYDLNTYISCGWFTDAECTNPFDFTAPVTGNITVYAGWVDLGKRVNESLIYNNVTSTYVATGAQDNDFMNKHKYVDTYSATDERSVYFVSRVAHSYLLKYNNAQSGSNKIVIRNLTKGTDEIVNTLSVTSTSQKTYTFNGEVGDVFEIAFSHVEGSSNLEWEMWHDNGSTTALRLPSGGKAGASNWSNLSKITAKETYAVKGTVIKVTASDKADKTFLGWFDGNGNKVCEDLTYVFTVTGDITLTAKWE